MNNLDELTDVVFGTMVKMGGLSAEIVLASLGKILDKLKNSSDKQSHFMDTKTKEGKMKAKDFINKHNSADTIPSENISKEQMKLLQKEFKKYNVDFSVRKMDKDQYSFLFAGKDSKLIEKAMENVSNKLSKKKEKKQEKEDKKFNTKDLKEKAKEKKEQHKEKDVKEKKKERER